MIYRAFLLSCLAESNRRPPPYQGDALPTEPRQPVRVTYATILIYTKPSLIVNIYLKIYQKSNWMYLAKGRRLYLPFAAPSNDSKTLINTAFSL